MKVLEATDFYYPWIAGPAPLIRNLADGLTVRGHEVIIACPSPTGSPYEEEPSPCRHRVRTWPSPFGYHLRVGFPAVDMWRLVKLWRPDVVHIHHPFPISLAALLAARSHNVPVVATNHTIPGCALFGIKGSLLFKPANALLSAHIRLVLSRADMVTTPTRTAASMLKDLGFTGQVRAISNGVDTERFRPSAEKKEPIPTILYTGRLDDDKDMNTFVDAVPHVLSRVNAFFRIGGEGTDRARLERRVADLGVTHAVRFTGYVGDGELSAVYRTAHLYAISSRVELQSISTLEAMASGLPVVAVNDGALPELVTSHVNGLLSPPGDPRAFAGAIVSILQDDAMARRMGLASRMAAERHSVKEMITQYQSLLADVAFRSSPGVAYGIVGG